jgi:hypothetical protein
MSIYTSSFKPTYLYIKQHSVTGKLYFGKTTKSNPENYFGSGLHWIRHIKAHGKEHVVTLWYCLFLDKDYCTKFALNFSIQQNIVESIEWLNLKPENGLDGGDSRLGKITSPETREKQSKAAKGIPKSKEHAKNAALGKLGKKFSKRSQETKNKQSMAKKNKPQKVVICPNCGKSGGVQVMKRWHFSNCRQ